MADYRYHFYDLSGVRLDVLPLENVTFGYELRGVGTLTGDVPLYGGSLSSRVEDATIPYRSKVFVERDNALVWGGRLIPPRDYDSTSGRMAVNAEETLGAFESRYVPSLTFTQVEQLDIARSLINTLQAEEGGDQGLLVGDAVSGVLRNRSYSAFDKTTGLAALTDLSEVEGGFEFATQTVWGDTGQPAETLLLGYPRLGRTGASSGLVLEYNQFTASPGNVRSYTWSDGPGLATRSWATTETDDGVQLVATTTNATLLDAGYPLLEQSAEYEGIVELATLQGHADALSAYAAGHRATAEFIVDAHAGLELGDWTLGDDIMVRISDWRWPPDPDTGAPGFATYMRLVAAEVTPASEGAETYHFTMADFLEAL